MVSSGDFTAIMTSAGMRLSNADTTHSKEPRFLRVLSFYFIPFAIVLLTLWILLFQPNRFPAQHGQRLDYRTGSGMMVEPSPERSQHLLQTMPASRLETPGKNWLLFQLPTLPPNPQNYVIRINDAALSSLQCQLAPDWHPLPVQHPSQNPIALPLQGYIIDLGTNPQANTVLCQLSSENTVLHLELWPADDLQRYATYQARGISLLEGGVLTLALLILLLAAITRSWTYLLLSIWLVGNLRLGAMAMTWDSVWLGHSLPSEYLVQIRRWTIACYFIVCASLFTRLFSPIVPITQLRRLIHPIAYVGVLLLALAPFVASTYYGPLLMASTALALGLLSTVLLQILLQADGRTRLWHLILLSMVLCVILSALYLIVFGRSPFIENFNGVITLILASLMAALVVAEHLRDSLNAPYPIRHQPQILNALAPVGFFILDQHHNFIAMDDYVQNVLHHQFDPSQTTHWDSYFLPLNWADVHTSTHGINIQTKADLSASQKGTNKVPQYFLLRALNIDSLIYGSLQDITETQQTISRLELAADSDPVTQLLNQRGLEKALSQCLDPNKPGQTCMLAYLNLNHIKYINPGSSQSINEILLKAVGDLVADSLGAAQSIARVNNDEFLILFPNSDSAQVHAKASEIIAKLNQQPITVGNRSFNLKSSIGLVEVSATMSNEEAISAAHRAAREAHKHMQDVVLYAQNSNELNEHAAELRLFQELEGGSSRGLFLEMQAIMSLKAPLDSLNFEILLRVHDAEGQLLPSGRIINAAEQSNTIIIIDKWVFGSTLEWLSKHERELRNTRQININLSGVSLNNDDFNESFIELLSRHEHLLKRICIEITEGVALEDKERTRQFMSKLQKMGVRIALDDFGAGYTSFQYLRELPADAIKIDGALICDMLKKDTNIAIVRTIVKLADNLGMVTIAEWVEDVATLKALADIGVDYVQGFGVARPCSPKDILAAQTILDLIPDAETREIVMELHHRQLS